MGRPPKAVPFSEIMLTAATVFVAVGVVVSLTAIGLIDVHRQWSQSDGYPPTLEGAVLRWGHGQVEDRRAVKAVFCDRQPVVVDGESARSCFVGLVTDAGNRGVDLLCFTDDSGFTCIAERTTR